MTSAAPARKLEESAKILETFERAVSRETYNLTRWAELTWQQLYNRLQWEDSARGRPHPERSRRSAAG